jgi:hypothetical protein
MRELYGRVAYTHKTHEKMAEKKASLQTHIKLWQIALSAIATTGAIGVIVTDGAIAKVITALFAVGTLGVSTYVKDIDPGALAQKHRQTASDLWDIREAYLSLLTDIRDDTLPLEVLKERRDVLQQRLHEIYKLAPHTDGDAYAKAQKALKQNEDLTFSDCEIDVFLPAPLKRERAHLRAEQE